MPEEKENETVQHATLYLNIISIIPAERKVILCIRVILCKFVLQIVIWKPQY